jgi:hypothetical protein
MTIFCCLRFETSPTWKARSPYFYTPGTGWPGYTPRHWVPFSSPPTTRRATVEVFDPASTRDLTESQSESKLLYDWRFTANQFVLMTSPLRLKASNFIVQLNTCGYSPYVTSSLTRGLACPLQLLLGLASAVTLRSESGRTHDHSLLSRIQEFPNLEGQVPVFIYPRDLTGSPQLSFL